MAAGHNVSILQQPAFFCGYVTDVRQEPKELWAMDRRTKKFLIGGCAVLVVLAVIVITLGYFAWQRFVAPVMSSIVPPSLQMPSELESPAVIVGDGLLSKSVFWEGKGVGPVTDIRVGQLDTQPGLEMGIAGSRGAVFADDQGNVNRSVIFKGRSDHVDIIDIENDGVCEFMNRGSWAIAASLIDHNGDTVWAYSAGVDDMAAGDIDGDGSLEFVVGFNGGGGVHLVETNGDRVWRQRDGNVWHVEMADTNGDGQLDIVHSNAAGEMKVRDRNGNILSQARTAPYFSSFSLCRWPTKTDRKYALLAEDETIWLFDFGGKSVAQFQAPECGKLGHARGVPVKLKSSEREYFAVIVEFRNWERSILYVYDANGALIYHEILAETCGSIAAMSLDDSATEKLLIGGKGRVWQYEVEDAP